MDGQFVDAQIKCGQVELVEHLIKCHFAFFSMVEHDHVAAGLHFLFDESQQMLLIHARCSVNVSVNLAHVVEVPVRHGFLLTNLFELIQHAVQLKLGLQVVQSPVAERFASIFK